MGSGGYASGVAAGGLRVLGASPARVPGLLTGRPRSASGACHDGANWRQWSPILRAASAITLSAVASSEAPEANAVPRWRASRVVRGTSGRGRPRCPLQTWPVSCSLPRHPTGRCGHAGRWSIASREVHEMASAEIKAASTVTDRDFRGLKKPLGRSRQPFVIPICTSCEAP